MDVRGRRAEALHAEPPATRALEPCVSVVLKAEVWPPGM